MAINLFDLPKKEPVNLLQSAANTNSPMDEDLDPMQQARMQIDAQHPNMPDWLKNAILSITPKEQSPMLDSAARGISNVTNLIPAAAGGILEGASMPLRGIASLIPGDTASRFANAPSLTGVFPDPETGLQKGVQTAGEFAGGGALIGKLMQGLRAGTKAAKIPSLIGAPASLAGAGYIATPGTQGDKALGAGGALALGAAAKGAGNAAAKLPEFFRGLSSKATPEKLVQSIQAPHDKLQSTIDELYGQVRGAIKSRNVKPKINPSYLDEITQYPSMNSKTHKELIQKAKDGDYEAIHKLQSSLYKKGTKDTLNADSVIETRGENLLELRNKINDDLESSLLQQGHIDIAHVLRQGKSHVAQLKDTYFNKLLPKSIGKMVHHETREIPKEPHKIFDKNSVPMKDFLAKHPDASGHFQGITEKEKAIKDLNRMMLKAGVGGAVMTGTKTIFDLLK